jgi:hypothetical protein
MPLGGYWPTVKCTGNVAYHYDGGDCVVGPTLFEFVRAHLTDLRLGRRVPLRFWDEGSSYGFVLVQLGVAPMRMRLGAKDEIVSYHGRVPPLLDGRSIDAETTYEYFAPFR